MLNDLRFALRVLGKSPGFTAVTVFTLALGIGANTAIFSLFHQVLLRSLPVHDPERTVVLHFEGVSEGSSQSDNGESVFSFPMYRDFRDRNQVFDNLIARASATVTVISNEEPERLKAELVSGNFFDALGIRPAIGRLLTSADDLTPGGHPVIVLSYGYWTRRFGGRSTLLSETLRVNGLPMTVLGVAPRPFRSVITGQTPDLYIPVAMKGQVTPWWNDLTDRRSSWLSLFGILKRNMTLRQAEAALAPVYRAILEEELGTMPTASPRFRARFQANRLELRPAPKGINQLQHQWERPLAVVLAMVGLLLLSACANVASLFISRMSVRQREIAIRLALGARRWQLIRQLLMESLVLSLASGLFGLVFSVWIVQGLIGLVPADALGGWLAAQIDVRLLGFACLLALVTCVMFGVMPATAATRLEVASALKSQAVNISKSHIRFRQVLVSTQVALSLVLLIAASLFVRSLFNLLQVDPGFRAERLLMLKINPGLSGYSDSGAAALFERLQRELRALPGVVSIAAAELTPLGNNNMSSSVTVEGYQSGEDEDTTCEVNLISPNYFQTLGVSLLSGREFTSSDNTLAPKVALVNETFAKHFFPNQSPIGKHLVQSKGNAKPDIEIVGVVRDSKHSGLSERVGRFYYLPYLQKPESRRLALFVRTAAERGALPTEVRRRIREIDSNLPVVDLGWMQDHVEESVYIERLVAWLGGAFGVLATLLAAVGLYGVIAYVTASRTTEIGIRMALGAQRRDVLWLVLHETLLLALVGAAVGLAGSLATTRLVAALLFGLSPTDPAMISLAVLVMILVAGLAAYLPARMATKVDPVVALRHE